MLDEEQVRYMFVCGRPAGGMFNRHVGEQGKVRAGLVSYFIFTKYRRFQAAQRRQNQRILSNLIKENGAGQGYFILFPKFQVRHCMA